MKLFAQIHKVDEEKRLVYGRAADETPDKSGEILNYDGSKPHFQKWSEDVAKDTDGKSLGNVRAMHGKVAAGKLTDIQFDDTARTIEVCAKVVDDNEWNKVLEGVYTGFSIGGKYGAKTVEKVDDKEFTRYIAIPNEISLVDRPCIPTAKFFEVQKADGTLTKVEFQEPADPVEFQEPADPVEKVEPGDDVEVTGTPEEIVAFGKLMNEKGLSMAEVIDLVKVAERKDVNSKEGEKEYGDVKFADEKNKKYPLDTEEHVRAAASYWGMPKNKAKYNEEDQKTIGAKIAAAEKEFKIGDDESSKAATATLMKTIGAALRKDLYACSRFAEVVSSLQSLQDCAEYEAFRERDGSTVPDRLAACVALCGQVLQEMLAEELAEEKANTGDIAMDVPWIAMAEKCGELAKYDGDPLLTLVKVGARHSGQDKARIQAIHQVAVDLGADCPTDMDGKGEHAGNLAKVEEAMQKAVAAAMEPMQKALDEAHEKIAKLEEQPAAPKVALRMVTKAQDDGNEKPTVTEADLVKDADGVVHPAASLIKQAQQTGGQPLFRG